MRNKLFAILTGLFLSSTLHAQEQVYSSSGKPLNRSEKQVKSDKLIDPDRFIIGGWGLFGIGSGITNVGASPIVGYRITDKFSAGVGFGYQYLKIKNYFQVPVSFTEFQYKDLNAHSYTPSVWLRHIIWNNIFAHAEYEHNITSFKEYRANTFLTPPYEERRANITVPCLLLGGGLRQPIGERTSIILMVLYDVLQHENSPYRNTVAFRFGINAGF